MRLCIILFFMFFSVALPAQQEQSSWIRINQMGYLPEGIKVAVWCSKNNEPIQHWQLVNAQTLKVVYEGTTDNCFGAYGPFSQTCRLNFSAYKQPGMYFLRSGTIQSPQFTISNDVYKGAADFCLRYMRQQRSYFNPFLKDSCHTRDGYVLYGTSAGLKDSSFIDVAGGWHDASDYLQYATTSANATYHLLMAYRDYPNVFSDQHQANGLNGRNGLPDVLDEAAWGLQWLQKMFPQPNIMFNQIGDDRDHMGMRIPKEDTNYYGRGIERPVYFLSGAPQQRGKYMNQTTGTSSTAAKFAGVFALAHFLYETDSAFRKSATRKGYASIAADAWKYANLKYGVSQTASVRSPYIYAEENWVDDMELAAAALSNMEKINGKEKAYTEYLVTAIEYAKKEKITPWLGKDTASHYQWYPFINIGHYELFRQLKAENLKQPTISNVNSFKTNRDSIVQYYQAGIERVWQKAKHNAFYRGVPFIWCSNNLTVSFAMQCYWYKQMSGNAQFEELEQAQLDWLFGCNPWGTSMVYGLPSVGDTPADPHSAFTHIKHYPIDGGLIDGPVYGSIYKNLIGITLYEPDEYAAFQSDLVVYHDDYGDYSTNEPTMDGTASLIYYLAAKASNTNNNLSSGKTGYQISNGGIIRGDSTRKQLAIVFTGDEYGEGADDIVNTLALHKVPASFFFTGRYLSNPAFQQSVQQLKKAGHYIGAHSDQHLLYCSWNDRDSLLVTKEQFTKDLKENYKKLSRFGIQQNNAHYFLPPYEWYNDSIAAWTKSLDLQLINFTPGTRSHADYTTPDMKNYRSSNDIFQSIIDKAASPAGLNGFILLMHIGTAPQRTDKFYKKLDALLLFLKEKGYALKRVDELLQE